MSETGGAAGGVREVKSAARTVELLEVLAARGDRPARLRELAAGLGVPRSSMYALLRTLISRGWVRTDSTGSLYGIGTHALLTGTSYLDPAALVAAATGTPSGAVPEVGAVEQPVVETDVEAPARAVQGAYDTSGPPAGGRTGVRAGLSPARGGYAAGNS